MTPDAVTPFLYAVAVLSWISTVVLLFEAVRAPHPAPTALRERAATSVVLAIFVTAYAIIAGQVDAGLIDGQLSRFAVRALALLLGLIPVWWLVLYARRFR